MKKTILVVSVLLAMTSAMSQGIGARCVNAQPAQLLEPLLPFSEAVEKAKAGNAQGWYALAIHYAKGEEVDRDYQKTCQFMQKACHMNYSNAVFVAAMMLEADYCATPKGGFAMPPIDRYVCEEFSQWVERKQLRRSLQLAKDSLLAAKNKTPAQSMEQSLSLTNAADVATIRAEYERAFSLGVTVATNELARFERRISSYQEEAKKDADEKKRKAENAKIAESLLIDLAPSNK